MCFPGNVDIMLNSFQKPKAGLQVVSPTKLSRVAPSAARWSAGVLQSTRAVDHAAWGCKVGSKAACQAAPCVPPDVTPQGPPFPSQVSHSGHKALSTAAQHLQGQAVVRRNSMLGWKIWKIFVSNHGRQVEPLNKHISGCETGWALCMCLQCMTGGHGTIGSFGLDGTIKIIWIQLTCRGQGHSPLAQVAQIHVGGNINLI